MLEEHHAEYREEHVHSRSVGHVAMAGGEEYRLTTKPVLPDSYKTVVDHLITSAVQKATRDVHCVHVIVVGDAGSKANTAKNQLLKWQRAEAVGQYAVDAIVSKLGVHTSSIHLETSVTEPELDKTLDEFVDQLEAAGVVVKGKSAEAKRVSALAVMDSCSEGKEDQLEIIEIYQQFAASRGVELTIELAALQ